VKTVLEYIKKVILVLGEDISKIPLFVALFLFSSIVEIAGLGLIGPYLTLAIYPDTFYSSDLGKAVEILELNLNSNILIIVIGLVLLGLFFIKAVISIWIQWKIVSFSQQNRAKLSAFLMRSYQELPYTDHLSRNSSEYIRNIGSLSGQFSTGVLVPIMKLLCDGIIALVIVVLLAISNLKLMVIIFTALVSFLIIYNKIFNVRLKIFGEKINEGSKLMLQGINEGIQGLKEMRILNKSQYFHQMVKNGTQKITKYHIRRQTINAAPRYVLEFLMVLFIVTYIIVIILSKFNLSLYIPTIGVFAIAGIRLMPAANSISSSYMQLRFSHDTVALLYEDLLQLKLKDTDKKQSAIQLEKDEPFQNIILNHVLYSYPPTKVNALDNVNLKISSGESIGIIGASGSGKTTLVDVLLGLLEPQSGEVLYNGKPLSNFLNVWRNQVAYLPQDIFLIDNTLSQNVALGFGKGYIDEFRLQESLRQANLLELVKQLPKGVETTLGEHGVRLSGGQRQRVALARAFYHGRNVLIMDEATSALDNDTEKEIINEVKKFKGSITMIVVAHRLTTIQYCDRIYRLDMGQIVETGTPEKVLKLA
jgi:ATP-binding cassette, subfamily B, bacterial PglK